MITSDEILKYLQVSPEKAQMLTSEINLLAGQYDIDTKKIIELLQKNPHELKQQKRQIEIERQQLKIDLNKMILPKK